MKTRFASLASIFQSLFSRPVKPVRRGRPFFWRCSLIGLAHLVALLVIVFLVWGLTHHRLSPKSWSVPLAYGGDCTFELGYVKAASEFDCLPFLYRFNSRLGAPYTANWNDFPMFEVLPHLFMGMVARWSNVITGWNVGIILSHLSSALAFYLACRLFRFRREWAFAGALLWAFSFYHNGRGTGHVAICFDYTVPLGLVCCMLMCASRRFRVGGGIFWLSMILGCAVALGNPYNANLWLQFVCLGIGIRFLRFGRKGDLLAGALVVGATMISFLAINANTLVYQSIHGGNYWGVVRQYFQLEQGALKPVELFLPPPQHRLVWLTDIGRQYSVDALVKGEMFSPYLGVVGIAAFIWLFAEFVLCALNRRSGPRRLPIYAPACLWVILYASIGGLNCLIGLFGLVLFRSSNRYSIFILAACLLFLVSRMSRLVRRWKPIASYALAAGVAAMGLLDQIPLPASSNEETALKTAESDRAFGQALEDGLPHGAMVFQSPIMQFPESKPVFGCDPYDHLRPYIWTKTLRFSFGSVRGRTREDWQSELASLAPEQVVKRLEDYGFSAICINLKGFPDHGDGLMKALGEVREFSMYSDTIHEQLCVRLTPSTHPSLPHSDDAAQIVYKHGWSMRFGPEVFEYWAAGTSSLYFVNDSRQARDFHMTGRVASLTPRRCDIQFEGKTIWTQQVEATEALPIDLRLHAKPGRNYLYFKSDRNPEPPPNDPQGVRRAQRIINLQIVKDSDAHDNFGVTLDKNGQSASAIRQLREAVRLKPGEAQAHNNLGSALNQEGHTDEALNQYREAIRLEPNFPEARNNLGVTLAGKGQIDEAIREYQEAVRLNPAYAEAHNNLGFAFYTKGQIDEASRHFQEAIRLNPAYAEAHNNLGLACYRQSRTDEAIRQFQEALRLKPDLVAARKNLDALVATKDDSLKRSGASTNR